MLNNNNNNSSSTTIIKNTLKQILKVNLVKKPKNVYIPDVLKEKLLFALLKYNTK